MREPLIADVTEMQDDAIAKFFAAFGAGRYDVAWRSWSSCFYLAEHRKEVPR